MVGGGGVVIKEIWKDIIGYEHLYQISNYGNVKSKAGNKKGTGNGKRERLLKLKENEKGYLIAQLWKENKGKLIRVHRLVAENFICSKPFKSAEINHKDFNRKNNFYKNLEWASHKQNITHSKINGRYAK